MKIIIKFTTNILFIVILIYSCKKSPDVSEKSNDTHILAEDRVVLNEEQRKVIPIILDEAHLTNFENSIELPGVIEADPDRVETIGTKLPGRILKIHKKEGEWIQKGEPIVTMESPEVPNLRARYQALHAKWEAALRNKERIQKLYLDKLASEQEKKFSEAEESALKAELESNRENLRLYGIEVLNTNNQVVLRASFSGTVLERYVLPGETVSENTKLLKIGDIKKVYFRVSIYEKDLAYVHLNQNAKIIFQAYPDKIFQGKLIFISPVREIESGSYPARILLENPSTQLKIGLLGRAIINLPQNPESQLSLHSSLGNKAYESIESAIIELESPGIYIFINDLEYQWKPVTILSRRDGKVYWQFQNWDKEIEPPPIVTYVKEGAYYLKAIHQKSKYLEE